MNGGTTNYVDGGSWFWVLIILFFLGNNNGWNGGNDFSAINAINGNTNNEFTQRDIFNSTVTGLQSANETQKEILENRFTGQIGDCNITQAILENKYQNALQTQTLSGQAAQNFAELSAINTANTQKILDKMCSREVDDLREKLNEARGEISQLTQSATLINALRPYPVPGYLVSSPYQSLYNGYYNGII